MTKFERQERGLLKRLTAAKIVEVVGVVAPSGAGGHKAQWQRQWELIFTFDAWRIAGAPMRTDPLRVRKRVTRDGLPRLMQRFRPYSVFRVRARVLNTRSLGGPHAMIVRVIGPDRSDGELKAHANWLRKPVIHRDPIVGTLTLDRRMGWFSCSTTWNRRPVELHVEADAAAFADSLATAHALWKHQAKWAKTIADYAVAELLPVKNDGWRFDATDAKVTPAKFRRRMTLKSISAMPGGTFQFWHEDGEMFGFHSIVVRGTLAEGPTRADIEG